VDAARADLRAAITERLQEDARLWGGWYRRHGGEIALLGDHLGEGDAASVLLAVLAVGLLWKMARQVPPPLTAPAAAKPASSRSRRKR
jgi:hypothetical protein